MHPSVENEVQFLRDQVTLLQRQMQTMQEPSDLPFSAHAVVNEVHAVRDILTELVLDGGTTHRKAMSPRLLCSMRSSHINSVLVAGGESHEVAGQGDVLLHTPQGDTSSDVACVPTFVVILM
jgi:hypothetical protein